MVPIEKKGTRENTNKNTEKTAYWCHLVNE